MKRKSDRHCGICNRPVGNKAKELPVLGAVGSDCYKKYSMLEEFLAEHVIAKSYPNQPTANAHADRFRRAGLKVDVKYIGEDKHTGQHQYVLYFKGRMNQAAKHTARYGITFKEYRLHLESRLKAAKEKRDAERLAATQEQADEDEAIARAAARAKFNAPTVQPSLFGCAK